MRLFHTSRLRISWNVHIYQYVGDEITIRFTHAKSCMFYKQVYVQLVNLSRIYCRRFHYIILICYFFVIWTYFSATYSACFFYVSSGEILVQERSQWQEPDSVLCFCWSGESIWPCPPKGLVVGYEKGGGRRVDSASSTSYVQQCTQLSESRLWV